MNALQRLIAQHRHCDGALIEAEAAARAADWPLARTAFEAFAADMLRHFNLEEASLFPAFEDVTGMRSGPTMVMRREHDEMRQLFADMRAAIIDEQLDDYLGASETMLILMQQHNMKEENILYPMCSNQLPNFEALVPEDAA